MQTEACNSGDDLHLSSMVQDCVIQMKIFGHLNKANLACPAHMNSLVQTYTIYIDNETNSHISGYHTEIHYSNNEYFLINTYRAKTKIVEFANSADLDEAAHYEQPHLDLLCLLCRL